MAQAKKVKQREENIRARAAAKKENKGKRGKPVCSIFCCLLSIVLTNFNRELDSKAKKKGFINK